jgi:hypothetical protein
MSNNRNNDQNNSQNNNQDDDQNNSRSNNNHDNSNQDNNNNNQDNNNNNNATQYGSSDYFREEHITDSMGLRLQILNHLREINDTRWFNSQLDGMKKMKEVDYGLRDHSEIPPYNPRKYMD